MDAETTLVNTFLVLSQLWQGGEYGYFWRKSDKRTRWSKLGTSYPLPVGNDINDIYWGVHPTSCIPPTNAQGEARPSDQIRGQIRHISSVACFFAEYDAKDFGGSKELALKFIRNRLFIAPSAIIDSGGGFHCYFFLDTPVMLNDTNRARMDELQKQFVHVVGSDDGAKDLARVLRVPGTFNTKYPTPRPVEFVEFSRVTYALDDIVSIMGDAHPVIEPANPIEDYTGPKSSAGLNGFVHGAPKGERNKKLFWAACKMYDAGADLNAVTKELADAAVKNGLPEKEVASTIKSAGAPKNRKAVAA